MPNRKKVASVIVAKLSGRPAASSESHVQKMGEDSGTGSYVLPEDDDDSGVPLEAAMDDFLRAVEKKDAAAMARAFRNAMVLCDMDGEGSETEEV